MLEDFPLIIKILFYFLGSFIITFILLPKIIQIAHQKELMVQPNKRSSHRVSTPAFGGVAFFISFIFMFSFLRNEYMIYSSNFIVPALTVLFVLGLKDDLVSVSPRTKILGQLLAIILILLSGEFIVYNLNGFMGIYQVSVSVLMPILVFLMLGIINAYNLIDGADGLASSVGLVIMGFFGYMFYQLGETFYFLTTFIIIGSFCAFLRFNLSKNIEKRLFMGDTGSLFIGFVMVIFTLKLLTIPVNHFHQTGLLADNLVCFIAGILFVPLFDTTRVMIIRYSEKKSILNPDRNHIHHLLLDSGFTHFETSLIVSFLAFLIMFSIL
jgi:UDP-N-acetylmuramyl pentapeptide phosphotransferase/UDP-N-acetylglucosamine-1-phosphate transferase